MIVQVKLFAVVRQLAGSEVVAVDLPDGATVSDLRSALVKQFPDLAGLAGHVMVAVNMEYAADDRRITPDTEVACIPPVSGG